MFEYQARGRFFAQLPDGIEDLAVDELRGLGAKRVRPVYRGIYFNADKAALYRVNYRTRHLTRILAPLHSFQCHSARYLYKRSKEIPWSDLLRVDQTFAVLSTGSHRRIGHSQYAALRLKDAVVDHFRERFSRRPSVDKANPDAWISLHIEKDKATVSLDTSGGSLHRRGYRRETVEAPMQETLAAAIVRQAQWDGSRPLYDPMCGSGTLLSEALMAYCRIPAGLLRRRFGFELMPDFDKNIWMRVKKEADRQMRPLPQGIISGSDISRKAVQAARRNQQQLPYGDRIQLKIIDFRKIDDLGDRIIVTNPPYGIRLGKEADLTELYKEFGDFLKHRCQGATVYVYFGRRALIPHMGLRPAWKKPLVSGGLEGRLAKFEIY
jgi:putative N6-adenine-specific DNA methylase